MKFTCDKCHTKYSIADERVKGRVLKIRCKSCNNVITVREEQHASPSLFAQSAASGHTSPVSLGDLEGVFNGDEPGGEHTVVSQGPLPGMNDPTPDSDEWYVSFDGEQEGPFPLSRAVERCKQEQPRGKEIHCWRPGFFVWLPLEEVPEFARAMKPARPPAIPAAARTAPVRPSSAHKAVSASGAHRAIQAKNEPASRKSAVTRDPTGPRAALAVANAVPGSSKDGGLGDSKPMPLPPPPDVPSPVAAAQVTRPESASAYRKASGAHAAQVAKAPADAQVVKRPAFPSASAAAPHIERKQVTDIPRGTHSSGKMPAVRARTDDKHHGENGFAAALSANAGGQNAPADDAKIPDTGPVPLPPPPGDELPIGEASGLLNLSHLKPGISGVRPRNVAVVETFGGVPVTSTPVSTPNGAAAGQSTATPVVVVAGPAPSAVPPWMKWAAIAGIVMTAILACVVVYLVTRPPVVKTVEVETPSRKLNDNPITMFDPGNPSQPLQPGQTAKPGTGPRHVITKNVPGAKQGPIATGDPQKGLSSAQRNLAQLYGEAETAQPHALPSTSGDGRKQASVSESALANVVQQNKAAMGLCYQRVLKHDPTLKSAKMVAKVKIGISGRVTNVSFGDPTLGQAEIGQCLAQSIKRWNFPSSDSEYDFEFPIVLTAN